MSEPKHSDEPNNPSDPEFILVVPTGLQSTRRVNFCGGPADGLSFDLPWFVINAQAGLNQQYVLAWKLRGVWYEDNGPTDSICSEINLSVADDGNAAWLEQNMPMVREEP